MKDLVENNKMIARFMGATKTDIKGAQKPIWYPVNNGVSEYENKLKYHSSWDWLIPVVNKCKEEQKFGMQHLIDNIDNVLTCDLTIENLYNSVVKFLKDYYKL